MRVLIFLDTPNLWRNTAIAGTPARVVALARALDELGAEVTFVVCDRGVDPEQLPLRSCCGWLVHPQVFYGAAEQLADLVAEFAPDLLVATDAELIVATARHVADLVGARLVYEGHDDEAALSRSLGEPEPLTVRRGAWQAAAVATADYVTALTDADAAVFRRYGVPDERLLVLPNGVDVAAHTAWGPAVGERRLLFVGNLHYQPNSDAVQALSTMLHQLRQQGPPVHARVIGRGPRPPRAPAGLRFTGPVPAGAAFDAAFEGVTLAVAPLTAGGGMKMKILDYLAAGLPVLATSEAVTGLPSPPPGVVVCDDLGAWPKCLVDLVGDAQRRVELGRAGRRFVEAHHSWGHIARRAVAAYESWCSVPPPAHRRVDVPEGASEPLWLAEHSRQDALGYPAATAVAPVLSLAEERRWVR